MGTTRGARSRGRPSEAGGAGPHVEDPVEAPKDVYPIDVANLVFTEGVEGLLAIEVDDLEPGIETRRQGRRVG